MGTKLGKRELPAKHSVNDFECFGPAALQDAKFEGTKIADMGCFSQGEVDSNKFYHGAVVRSKLNQNWYAYFEWGRVGGHVDFQFVDCGNDQADAESEYAKQCHAKNDKRGVFKDIGGQRVLVPKPGEDSCYRVQKLQTRSTGLPDAKRLITADSGGKKPAASAPIKTGAAKPKADQQTTALMRDLGVATVQYTKSNMVQGMMPTQTGIDEARDLLTAALKRVGQVGDDLNTQIGDKELKEITELVYSKIPKIKVLGAAASTWILSQNNIVGWQKDLDAFESALASTTNSVAMETDPFDGIPVDMNWLDPKSSQGAWVMRWAPKATRNRHGGVGDMKVKNVWSVARHGDEAILFKRQDEVAKDRGKHWNNEKALHQPDVVPHVGARKDVYADSHTAALFHGTRMVNVTGILRKSLLMPKQLVGVAINGAMFGGGLYFADDWKKSAGYTDGGYYSRGGGGRNRGAFMFIADVVLGNPHVANGPHGYTDAPKGHHCVFGKADVSNVMNNEWIVFKSSQHMLRYLIEFDS